jgi:hypothetical protein
MFTWFSFLCVIAFSSCTQQVSVTEPEMLSSESKIVSKSENRLEIQENIDIENTEIDITCIEKLPQDKLVELILSKKRGIAASCVMELDSRINRGAVTDIPDKHIIYKKIKLSEDNSLIYKVVTVLSKLPKDNQIVNMAVKDMQSKQTNFFVAGYGYLVRCDEELSAKSFPFTDYNVVLPDVRQLFHYTQPISQIRNQWIKITLENYMSFRSDVVDGDNPYRKLLLEERTYVVEYISENWKKYANPVLPLSLVWLLGEFGDSKVFDLMLETYCDNVNMRTAISLGACLEQSRIDDLFSTLNPAEKNTFIQSILTSDEYDLLKNYSTKELIEYWRIHFIELKKRCIDRSIPQLG